MTASVESTDTMTDADLSDLYSACEHYFQTFFVGRDAKASAALATPDISGFGTGIDESVYELDDALTLYRRDVEQVPAPIHYTVHRREATRLGPGVGLVMGEMDWHLHAADQAVTMHRVRFSLTFQHDGAHWKLCHKHLSQPSSAHGPGEGYPLKELEDRAAVLKRMVDQRTEELEAAHREMRRIATTDTMTGLHNRYHTEQVLQDELKRQGRVGTGLTVILLDVDNFKPINDAFGHHVGDKVLADLAPLLQSRIRETDVLGRWGGEEFLIICPDTSLSEATVLAQHLCDRVAAHPFPHGRSITLSLGVAAHAPQEPGHALLERADRALYQAKAAGRNRVITADR